MAAGFQQISQWPNWSTRRRVRVFLDWTLHESDLDDDRPKGLGLMDQRWSWTAGNLLAAIALQTAFAASGHSGLARCANCGDVYRPCRAVRLDQLHFCPRCGHRASVKLYMRRVREGQKQLMVLKKSSSTFHHALSSGDYCRAWLWYLRWPHSDQTAKVLNRRHQ